MEERREPHGQACLGLGRSLHDGEEVLVEREWLPLRVELVADRRLVLGHDLDERARVAGEPKGERRPATEQELRELPHPVRLLTAADPLGGDVAEPGGLRAHLGERLVGERELEL